MINLIERPMKKMSAIDRLLLLLTGLLAAYQIAIGVEGAPPVSLWAYSVGFGILWRFF